MSRASVLPKAGQHQILALPTVYSRCPSSHHPTLPTVVTHLLRLSLLCDRRVLFGLTTKICKCVLAYTIRNIPLAEQFISFKEPNDLSFSVGETIEILDETNADWWTGRCRGRQGLFPSNHVQVIPAASSPIASPPPSAPPAQMPIAPVPTGPSAPYPPAGYNNNPEKPVYRPFGAVYQGTDQPPPAQVQVAPVNTVGLQQAPGQEQKQKKWGRLGNTVRCSSTLCTRRVSQSYLDGEFCCWGCRLWSW